MGLLDDAIREHLDLKRSRGADPTEVERAEHEALGPVRRAPETRPGADALVDGGFAYDHEDESAWREAPAPGSAGAVHEPDFGDEHSGFEDDDLLEPEPEQRPSRFARLFGRPDRAPQSADDELDPEPTVQRIPRRDAASEAGAAPVPEDEADELAARRPPPHAAADPFPAAERADEAADPAGELGSRHAVTPPPADGRLGHTGGETVEYDVEQALGSSHSGAGKDEDPLEETPEFLQDTPDHDRLWFEQRPPRDFDFDG